ncbi:Lipid A biosynthesis acyltransferase [Sterolibacterium denitrificans]|uniref:Lipid A biosynthesis acyltransferase n=1 Tax=Sterolibacterium denitrificans TaxID=157592 RepID=A0A7Z7HPN0_9PROT|nr:lipid A biosynthesis acyltransferase [Sterolibacterium denitrificans]SMB22278.1 Lipid A biosynthesis acyltransferase [Sterolibacterium denitrificans]
MMTRLALVLMWLLHFLPLPLQATLGRGLGLLLYWLVGKRRRIALTNLRLCFPQLSEAERNTLVRRHFAVFGRSFIERGLLWWASPARLRRIVRVEGMQHLDAQSGRPVILLVPHFVGLDMGWTRLTLERDMVSIYANQKNLLFNAALYRGRLRFGNSQLLSRQQGTRPALRAMRSGMPFYYLPDMDYGERDTIFVPFFGVPAATITGLSRLARMGKAVVLPVITRMLPGGRGYVVEIQAPWTDFPGESIEADTRRMNAYIENEVLKLPEQYFWLHKRFKTRPPGESGHYEKKRD